MFLIRVIWALVLLATPFYFSPSGLPQISDFLCVVFILFVLVVSFKNDKLHVPYGYEEPIKVLSYFVVYTFFVSVIWDIIINDSYILMAPIFYLYNFTVFMAFIVCINFNREYLLRITAKFVALSVVLQVALSPISANIGGFRQSLFFNNPNQLGYYSVLSCSIYLVIAHHYKFKPWFQALVVLSCLYLSALSLSKAAMLSIVILIGFSTLKKPLVLIVTLILFLIVFNYTDLYEIGTKVTQRISTLGQQDDSFSGRGYDRIVNHQEYLLFGAGEGATYRFDSEVSGEIHSILGTILFSYGLVGLLLFLYFLYKTYEFVGLSTFAYFIPPLLYGVTHQGFRDTFFWLLFAVVLCVGASCRGEDTMCLKCPDRLVT